MDVVGFKQLILMSSLDGSVKMSDGLANLRIYWVSAKCFLTFLFAVCGNLAIFATNVTSNIYEQ